MTAASHDPRSWLAVTAAGLYCRPGGFYVDPLRPVERAVITHGHADHARPDHGAVLATAETLAVMRLRYAERAGQHQQALAYGETIRVGDVAVTLVPAGHVLGSAQVVLDYGGHRCVVTGDFKRQLDPTCPPFEPVPCDTLVTEATFALPVFRHPAARGEVNRLLRSLALFPERSHVVGTYPLGKTQRLICELRAAGFDQTIYLHGALARLCQLYREHGLELGPLAQATAKRKQELAGAIVLAPPSATRESWARRLADPVVALASGWLRVRQRARQGGVELPLIVSDHGDWDDLCATVAETGCRNLWVTHGQEDGLVHWARQRGVAAEPLRLVGYGEDEAATDAPGEAAP